MFNFVLQQDMCLQQEMCLCFIVYSTGKCISEEVNDVIKLRMFGFAYFTYFTLP